MTGHCAALTALALLGLAGTSRALGQQTPPRTPERGAEYLELTFAVVTADGTPVADLRADELTVRIGGRARAVRSMHVIPVDGPAAGARNASTLPPPFGTNVSSGATRTLVLAIDEDSFRPGSEGPLRQAADALIARVGDEDRVAVVTMPFGGVKVPFTTDHVRVRTALSQIVGQAPANQTGSELACRSRRTLEALVSYLETLGVRNDPTTIMFVTAGLAAPRRDAVSALAPGMCELSENLFTQVATAAGRARAHFYVIRPGDAADRGASVQRETSIGSDNPLAGIEHLVGATGGKLLSLTGSAGTALERVVRETSARYLATVAAQPNDRSGRSQQLDVRVSRRGVEVRTHPHITFAKADAAAAKLLQPSLRDMLGTPALFRDLPIRAAGFPALAADGQNIRIVALAEPAEPGVNLESLAAVLFDRDGKVASQWLATAQELQRSPVMGAMSAPPGAYRLRIAAIDTTGRSGTADYEVTAEIVRSGPLRLSSLVLGLNRVGGFVPKLQFTTEPLAVAYVEFDGAPAGAKVLNALEVAQTTNGPAIVTVPLAIQSSADNRYTAMGSLAVGALPPGDYVVRAMVGLEGHAATRVVRTMRKAAPVK